MEYLAHERPPIAFQVNENEFARASNAELLRNGQRYTVQRIFPDIVPGQMRKIELRHAKHEIIEAMLDRGYHGYLWLVRFDETRRRTFIPGSGDGDIYQIICEMQRISDYEQVVINHNARPIIMHQKLSHYSTADLVVELTERIKQWVTNQAQGMRRRLRSVWNY